MGVLPDLLISERAVYHAKQSIPIQLISESSCRSWLFYMQYCFSDYILKVNKEIVSFALFSICFVFHLKI